MHALTAFNAKVISNDALSIEEVVDHPHQQQLLSSKLEAAMFNQLINNSSAAGKARLYLCPLHMHLHGNPISWSSRCYLNLVGMLCLGTIS